MNSKTKCSLNFSSTFFVLNHFVLSAQCPSEVTGRFNVSVRKSNISFCNQLFQPGKDPIFRDAVSDAMLTEPTEKKGVHEKINGSLENFIASSGPYQPKDFSQIGKS